MNRRLKLTTLLTLWLLVGTGAAAAGARQNPPAPPSDSPWLPWLGCWQLVEETSARVEQPGGTRPMADRVAVCLSPVGATAADADSMRVTTVADGEPVLVETLVADGAQHPVEGAECTGWRRITWSRDGARLFSRAELACDVDQDEDTRHVSGVGLMASATTWLDIQLVETGGRGAVTIRRYRRAGLATTLAAGAAPLPADLRDQAMNAARLASTSELSVEDLIEADHAIEPAGVEAMLVETGASFAVDSRTLIQLADGGVSADVIDLVVALSFPDEFVVDRESFGGGGGGGYVNSYSPYGFDRWYPYYASPFGYYYGWSAYSSLYYYGPAASYGILPGQPGGGSTGRAYQGRGYTSVDVRRPGPLETGRRARRRGTGTSTQAARGGSGDRSGTSDGGGRATQGGYTRGGSSGRAARPRDR